MSNRTLIPLAAVALVVGGTVAVAHAATSQATNQGTTRATCTTNPRVADQGSSQQITVVCTVPKPPAVTVTTGPSGTVTTTVTADPSTSTSPSESDTPTAQPPTATTSTSPTESTTPTVAPPPSPTASGTPTNPPADFPNASNTGVPAGTALSTYTGSCTITSAVTIDSKTMNCSGGVTVEAAGVVIKNSKINGRIVVDTDTNQSWSLSLTDSEVNADGIGGVSAITNGNVTILRADIHGGHNALQCEEHASICSMTDSWVHDQYLAAGSADHLGGVASFGSAVPCKGPSASGVPACVELVHNSIVCDAAPTSQGGGCTGDINLLPQYGPLNGAIIKNNLLGGNPGSAYCTYGGAGMPYPASHIIYMNNVFERGTNNNCADYGPVTNFDVSAPGNVWSGNVWDDGTPVRSPN
jgi:hypothetical protein